MSGKPSPAEEIQARLVRVRCPHARCEKHSLKPAEKRADFIHKLRTQGIDGDSFVANGLFFSDKLDAVIAEDQELGWILAASIKTARRASI